MTCFDIVIVNFNSTDFLISCLGSVKRAVNGYSCRIFVQDNASADNVERIEEMFPDVRLSRNRANIGFARAVNQAVRKGRGEYVVLLNPDAQVHADFFSTSLSFLDRHPEIGMMGPRICDADGGLQNSARAFPTPLTAFFGRSSFISRRFPKNPITSRNLLSLQSDGRTPMPVDWVSGACMVVRRAAIEQVGLLDERFFMYWEDTDWCRRMWAKGWKVVYYPCVTVCHYVGGSSEKRPIGSVIAFHKSVYRLFDKYLPPTLSFLRPLVLGGLASRLLIVIASLWYERCVRPGNVAKKREDSGGAPKPPVTVLRIISRLNIGGPAIHVHLLTNGLSSKRFHSILVSGQISPKEGDMRYLFHPSDHKPVIISELQREIRPHLDLMAFLRIFHLIVRHKPHIVHTHTAKAGFTTRIAVWLYNQLTPRRILCVHTFHGHVFTGYFNPFTSAIFRSIERTLSGITDLIIAISPSLTEELATRHRIAPREKIRTIPLGFDLTPFLKADLLRGEFRARMGIPQEALFIGIVGRLVPIKRHELFLDAAHRFVNQNPHLPVRFMIIGDGERRGLLEKRAGELGLGDQVVFCGWIKAVQNAYADMDILALTSLNEGTPVSLIESMAASVPVVATDAGGVKDLLGAPEYRERKGYVICQRGILCPATNDPDLFAAALTHLVREDPNARQDRIAQARRFVEVRYTQEHLIRKMTRLYDELLAASRVSKSPRA